jgi:hypothetical protein
MHYCTHLFDVDETEGYHFLGHPGLGRVVGTSARLEDVMIFTDSLIVIHRKLPHTQTRHFKQAFPANALIKEMTSNLLFESLYFPYLL